MNLEAFMIEEKEEIIEYKVSKRFVDKETGEVIPWKIRVMTAEENQNIRRDCYIKTQIPGKRNQFTRDFDSNKYLALAAEQCVIDPDLQNVKLQDFYKVKSVRELLGKMLRPGEYDDLMEKIQEINGYSLEEKVEEAKN